MSFFTISRFDIRSLRFAMRRIAKAASLVVLASVSGLTATANAADDTFSCLSELYGPLVDVQGTVNVNNDWFYLGEGTRLDARGDIFTSETYPDIIAQYPVDIRTLQSSVCWAGGAIYSTNPPDMTWHESKDRKGDGIISQNNNMIVDGVRIHNAHDGIMFWSQDVPRPEIAWQIRNSWITYNRDDCIEDDWYLSGLVDDSLFDGCYVFLSTRGGTDFGPSTVTVRNSLIRMQKMPGPYGHPDEPDLMAHGGIFKNNTYGSSLVLENNVFLVEGYGATKSDPSVWPAQSFYSLSLGQDKLKSCSNNVIVWLGPGDYPGDLPNDPSCVTVTKDRTVWDHAREKWLAEHPLVMRIEGVDEPVPEPDPTPDPIPDPTPDPVLDTTPPTVRILSPAKLVQRRSNQIIEVDADDDVAILRVEIYIDGALYAALDGAGFVDWKVPGNPHGRYVIEATAIDTSGNFATDIITVFATR